MTKVEALKELLYEDNRPRTTKASIYRAKRIAKALDLTFEQIAFEVLCFHPGYVKSLLEERKEPVCTTTSGSEIK